MINLTRIPQTSLGEISQSMAIRFAILSGSNTDGFTQLTPTVKCRDFLCDVYSSALQKFSFSIYGMSWDGANNPISFDQLSLLLLFPSETAKKAFFANINKLHGIEEHNSFNPTAVYESEQISGASNLEVIVDADPRWLMSVLSFSLYTLLLRIMCYDLPESGDWIGHFAGLSHSDSRYINSWPRESLDKILNNLSLLKMESWNGLTYAEHKTGGVHHNSGIVSVFSSHSEINQSTVRQNKHWQHFQSLGLPTCIK